MQKPSTLVLVKKPTGISVFFHGREIICSKDKKPFAEVIICEATNGKNEKTVQKTVPLCLQTAEKTPDGIKMLFAAKGHTVRLDIKEEEKQLHIKIKKEGNNAAKLYFPRGTKEKVSIFSAQNMPKTKENSVFYTKTPNVAIEDFMYNLKTAKAWDVEVSDRDLVYKIKGEKAKLFVIKAGDAQDNIRFYFSQDNIGSSRHLGKGIYFNTEAERVEDKIFRLIAAGLDFDGVVFSYDAARLDEFYGRSRRIRALGKSIMLRMKPYLPVKYVGEIMRDYLVRDKSGELLVTEIDGEKQYAVNLADKDARRWLQNQLRNYLDYGVKGIIAECGRIDEDRAALPLEEKFSYGEIWYILWQRLVREVVDEYPDRFLLLRHNGPKSPKFGMLLTDEVEWKAIEGGKINDEIASLTLCGMGEDIITELGGIKESKEKKFLNAEKWFLLCRNKPLIIFGKVPEKVVKKYYYLLERE